MSIIMYPELHKIGCLETAGEYSIVHESVYLIKRIPLTLIPRLN